MFSSTLFNTIIINLVVLYQYFIMYIDIGLVKLNSSSLLFLFSLFMCPHNL